MRFETRWPGIPSNFLMGIRALPLVAAAVVLAALPAMAQFGSPFPGGGIGYPGTGRGTGYPGGGGGGLPFPGRNSRNNNGPAETLTGRIQRISTTQIILDPGDQRNIMIGLDRNTKYFTETAAQAKFGDFDNGDEVSVDATRDNQSMLHGQRVTMVHKANPVSLSENAPANSDPDRPKLRRAGAAAEAAPADTPAPSRAGAAPDDPDRPRLRRTGSAESSAADQPGPRAQITDGDPVVATRQAAPREDVPLKPVPREADDPGPPVLRRGVTRVDRTPPAGSQPESAAASARPSIRAEDVNGVARLPAAPIVEEPRGAREDDGPRMTDARAAMQGPPAGDPIIQAAREAAWQFSDTLPNYTVKQYTTRYQTDTARGSRTSWQALDVVTADVVSENGKESYRNILVNGKAPKDGIEKTGSWSTGEFSTILLNLLAPATDADFHGKRNSTIVNRQAFRYDYTVEQPNSNWNVIAASQSYKPSYSGSIWVDKQTSRVLRIEMSAKNMPAGFPLDAVESAVDYDFVLIGDQKFLLPVHSEALSCTRGSSDCTRNTIDFRNYRKFGADTSITFETDK